MASQPRSAMLLYFSQLTIAPHAITKSSDRLMAVSVSLPVAA